MKTAIFAFALGITIAIQAQTPPNPLAPPTAPGAPGLPASPALPNLPATPASPGFSTQPSITGGSNAFSGSLTTNRFGAMHGDLSSALQVLQNDLQQSLTLLAGFNANASLIAPAGFQALPGVSTVPTVPPMAGSPSLAQNLGVAPGANLAANVAVNPAGGTASPTPPTAFGFSSNAPVPAGALAPAGTGVSNVFALNGGLAGTNSTAGTGAPVTAALLLILENDMQRMLPELAAINGGLGVAPSSLSTNAAGVSTNRFTTMPNTVTPRTTTPTATPRVLTPTGR